MTYTVNQCDSAMSHVGQKSIFGASANNKNPALFASEAAQSGQNVCCTTTYSIVTCNSVRVQRRPTSYCMDADLGFAVNKFPKYAFLHDARITEILKM